MAVCRNPACQRAYQSQRGIVVVDVRVLRANHAESRAPAALIIRRLTELAPQIYQAGPHCAECQQEMATVTGPQESAEVNDLLANTELLGIYGVAI
jgi:hypothetical protein